MVSINFDMLMNFQIFCNENGIVSITPLNDDSFIGYEDGIFKINGFEIKCK